MWLLRCVGRYFDQLYEKRSLLERTGDVETLDMKHARIGRKTLTKPWKRLPGFLSAMCRQLTW